jgi:hypothetical protein
LHYFEVTPFRPEWQTNLTATNLTALLLFAVQGRLDVGGKVFARRAISNLNPAVSAPVLV